MQQLCISPRPPQSNLTVINALFGPPLSLCIIREHSELLQRGSCDGVPHGGFSSKNVYGGQSLIFCPQKVSKEQKNMDNVLFVQLLFGYFLWLVSFCFVFSFRRGDDIWLPGWIWTHDMVALMCFSQLSHQGTSVYPCLGDIWARTSMSHVSIHHKAKLD